MCQLPHSHLLDHTVGAARFPTGDRLRVDDLVKAATATANWDDGTGLMAAGLLGISRVKTLRRC